MVRTRASLQLMGNLHAEQQCGEQYSGKLRLLTAPLSMQAAVGEAGFMTGLERMSEIVTMAAYAPLLVNTHDRSWSPNLIVFDNHRQARLGFPLKSLQGQTPLAQATLCKTA